MPEVSAALAAVHLGPRHPVAAVHGGADRSFQRLDKAGPPGAALELAAGHEERLPAARARKRSGAPLGQERARTRRLRAVAAQHRVLRRCQRLPPLGVGLLHGKLPLGHRWSSGQILAGRGCPAHTAYSRSLNRPYVQSTCCVLAMAMCAWPHASSAQGNPPAAPAPEHQHEKPADQHAGHVMSSPLFSGRDNGGTGWTPARTPMLGDHRQVGPWNVMIMGNAFVQYLDEFAPIHRGARQLGSTNWAMGMGRRSIGAGIVGARAMLSAESVTIRGCGYPNLLASGELCEGDGIHDKQHPHDLVMELAGEYARPISPPLRWHVYGGPVGEPALGPVAFPHRASALPNPVAPISHHWLDATHISYGVVTTGLTAARWRLEGSV